MAGAFWSIPRGKWTIDIDEHADIKQITVLCDGKAVAWGGDFYFEDMVETFRRYQWSALQPDCRICGHEYHNHLNPMGFELSVFTPSCHCGKAYHSSERGCSVYREACHWGGGYEGWCYCPGYQPETEKLKYDGRHCPCPDQH